VAAVEIQGLTKSYGDNQVLSNLDIEVGDGEFLTLLGPSGCGKTTTLRCVAGLERADGG
jgi:ABC-type Fe3+/spermidine/putrescine transport system ATPase subunit